MDHNKEKDTSVEEKVSETLTDEVKEAWRNFMEKCQQSMDLDQSHPARFSAVLNKLGFGSKISWKQETLVDANQADDPLPEKRVFENHLLAKSIFKCLSYSDLLSCRLVNSKWNELATQALLKRDHKIKFQRRNDRFYLKESNWKTLDMLTQLLGTSKGFPCTSFYFGDGNLGNDDAQRFFSFYGPFIKSMEISERGSCNDEDVVKFPAEQGFFTNLTDARVLGMILSQQLQNLEALELCLGLDENPSKKSKWYQSLLFPAEMQIQLPNLKNLTFERQFSPRHDQNNPILRQILMAAVNLHQFHEFETKYMDLLMETGRTKSIRRLYFPQGTRLAFDQFEELAEHGLELCRLGLDTLYEFEGTMEFWTRISDWSTKLLNSSQKTLEVLYLANNVLFLPQFQLPVLENVKVLTLALRTNCESRSKSKVKFSSSDFLDYSSFLPRGATFAHHFPKLHRITLRLDDKISDVKAAGWWGKYFSTDEIVPTVRELEIMLLNPCSVLWLEKCSLIFPNITKFTAYGIKDFPASSQILWTFKKLTYIYVGIRMTSPLNRRPFILDSSFTGIPPEKIKNLQSLSLATLEQMGGSFGENPSILNLTELRTLNISFYLEREENREFGLGFSLNHVTGLCAFNPLKSLQEVNVRLWGWGGRTESRSIMEKKWKHLEAYKVTLNL